MEKLDSAIIGFGLALHALLLWRCLKERHWKHYSLFFTYLAYTFLRTLSLVTLRQSAHPSYALIYWYSDLGAVLLRFGVAWDVFRHIFQAGSAIRAIAGRVLFVVLVAMALGFIFLSNQPGGFFLDMERKAGLAVVAWLVVVMLLARYYCSPIGTNIWGMALGMGLFVSISIANFAAFDLLKSFLPIWRFISPFSFLVMMLIWTSTLWSYAPEPQLKADSKLHPEAALAQWKRSWNQFGTTIRRAIGQ